MNLLKFHALFLLLLFMLIGPSPAEAVSVKGATVSVYNSGQALVKEFRSVNLPKGMASVIFKDVPRTIDPTSVHATAEGMRVLDIKYSYLPMTTKNLLDRFVGKELTVILPDPTDANGRVQKKATLLSNAQRPVFLIGTEVYIGSYDGLLLPEMPKGLQQEPTLTVTAESASAAKRNVELSYLMGGLNWRADYTLSLDSKGEKGALDAWATISNSTGRGFTSSLLKLVAGDVNRVPNQRRPQLAKGAVMMEADMVSAAPPPAREDFSQFHVYDIGRKISLPESGTKQLNLFTAPRVEVEQELISRYGGGVSQRRGPIEQGVEATMTLKNTKKNGLGRPMPGGLVRVYMPTTDGNQLLAGEARIGHIGDGGEAKLSLGRAFDMAVSRSQTSYKKTGKNAYEIGWRIEIINSKDRTQQLTLQDMIGGEWEVMNNDREFTMPDAGTLEFALTVPPTKEGTPFVVNYTVQVTY